MFIEMKFEIVSTSHIDDNDEPGDHCVGGSLTGNMAFQKNTTCRSFQFHI